MKLLEHVRQVARAKHLAYRTEQAYAYWITLWFTGSDSIALAQTIRMGLLTTGKGEYRGRERV